jgi:hypothetical protein
MNTREDNLAFLFYQGKGLKANAAVDFAVQKYGIEYAVSQLERVYCKEVAVPPAKISTLIENIRKFYSCWPQYEILNQLCFSEELITSVHDLLKIVPVSSEEEASITWNVLFYGAGSFEVKATVLGARRDIRVRYLHSLEGPSPWSNHVVCSSHINLIVTSIKNRQS